MSRIAVISSTPLGTAVVQTLRDGGAELVDVGDAHIVLGIVPLSHSRRTVSEVGPALANGALYADFSDVTPEIAQACAEVLPEGAYVDVGVCDPLPGSETLAKLTASGPRATDLVDAVGQYGLRLERVSDRVGDASARRLVRSILTTGIAAAIIDALWAGQMLGFQDWMYEEVLRIFGSLDPSTAKAMLSDTVRNVKRRQLEMMNVSEMLDDVGYTSTTGDGVALTYSRLLHSVKVPYSNAS
ncbi:hypothetical protein BOH66_06340 [Microbacterium aurum]|uniref:6-phosphogluconate dehydrogenase NADP-binding domain-containing protein n=1 Tax=Microbacterium aurum TaxID=36805 RepID=A0A1P8U733_9MICO|nr:hypothetical protein [Microbacterium aurum]APZ33918.1 hypothetical protein BOH66_06340 [Microbacterium aurum]MBM7827679.1 3-hydroxyisobutyrate dehydrogenase-like beta-hydroxyacid dehydrogenase [Microbacterium aurum]